MHMLTHAHMTSEACANLRLLFFFFTCPPMETKSLGNAENHADGSMPATAAAWLPIGSGADRSWAEGCYRWGKYRG